MPSSNLFPSIVLPYYLPGVMGAPASALRPKGPGVTMSKGREGIAQNRSFYLLVWNQYCRDS